MEAMAIINEAFQDSRMIEPLDETMHLFRTDDNEIIYLDIVLDDFTTKELLDNVELAEELYKEHQKKINVYLICHKEVKVKEFNINSEADFSIRLANFNINPYYMVLEIIKKKIENGETLTDEDIEALTILPLVCSDEDRHNIRKEVFNILNTI